MKPITAALIFLAGAVSVPVAKFFGNLIVSIANMFTFKRAMKRLPSCACGCKKYCYKIARGYEYINVKCVSCGKEIIARPKRLLKAWNESNNKVKIDKEAL